MLNSIKRFFSQVVADITAQGFLVWLKTSALAVFLIAIWEWIAGRSPLEVVGLLFLVLASVLAFFELLAKLKLRNRTEERPPEKTEDIPTFNESMTTSPKKHFRNEEVVIDGMLFEDATFDNVTLVYHGKGTFAFHKVHFSGNTQLRSTNKATNAFMTLSANFRKHPTIAEVITGSLDAQGNLSVIDHTKKQAADGPDDTKAGKKGETDGDG